MKINLPGVFWIVLILALIPAISAVLENFWPSSQYYVTALVVAVLGALAKAIQMWAERSGELPPSDGPQAAAAPTVNTYSEPGKAHRFLFG